MGKINYSKAIALVIAANFVFGVGVGCGDGSRKKRTKVNRADKAGQKTTSTTGVGGRPGAPGGATPGPAGDGRGQPAPVVDKDKSTKMGQIEKAVKERSTGTPIQVHQLDEGSYKLEEVVSEFRYMNTAKVAEDVQHMNHHGVSYTPNGPKLVNTVSIPAGILVNQTDAGRAFVVPHKIEVKGVNGQAWKPTREAAGEVRFHSQLVGNKQLQDQFTSGAEVADSSLMDILATAAGDFGKGDIGYQQKVDGREIQVRVLKTADSKIRLLVRVAEQDDSKTKPNSPSIMSRQLILTYSFVRAPAPTPTPTPTPGGAPADNSGVDEQAAAAAAGATTTQPAGTVPVEMEQ